jgi:hypothetical protein
MMTITTSSSSKVNPAEPGRAVRGVGRGVEQVNIVSVLWIRALVGAGGEGRESNLTRR